MNHLVVVVVGLVVLCCAQISVSQSSDGCGSNWIGASGKSYNLAPLTRPTSNPWTGKENYNSYIYYWNFCVNLVGMPPQVSALPSPAAVMQIDGPNIVSVGALNNYNISEINNGLVFTYTNSAPMDMCPDNGGSSTISRVTSINVMCDLNDEGTVLNITEPPARKCSYNIAMKSKYACSSKCVSSTCAGQQAQCGTLIDCNQNVLNCGTCNGGWDCVSNKCETPGLKCCLYKVPGTTPATKAICTKDISCPVLMDLPLEGAWTVDNCTQCNF